MRNWRIGDAKRDGEGNILSRRRILLWRVIAVQVVE
jgi:hypothetical protein